jgi:hypothetical protein
VGRAQVFFLDEFNGNALGPHWQQPPSDEWAYNVSGGQLNVTGLFFPNPPEGCCNTASTVSFFQGPSAPRDFRASVRMGWDPGTDQGIEVILGGVRQERLIEFGYDAWGGHAPAIYETNGLDFVRIPPPLPGMYEFTVERRGSLYELSLDGVSVGTLAGGEGQLGFIQFRFWGPAREPLGPLLIDRVEVVPTPGAMIALALTAVLRTNCRRRRECPVHGNLLPALGLQAPSDVPSMSFTSTEARS